MKVAIGEVLTIYKGYRLFGCIWSGADTWCKAYVRVIRGRLRRSVCSFSLYSVVAAKTIGQSIRASPGWVSRGKGMPLVVQTVHLSVFSRLVADCALD